MAQAKRVLGGTKPIIMLCNDVTTTFTVEILLAVHGKNHWCYVHIIIHNIDGVLGGARLHFLFEFDYDGDWLGCSGVGHYDVVAIQHS